MQIVAFIKFGRAVEFLTGGELFLGLLWMGLAALSVALLILAHTRWGQSRPLRKCFILSLLAHVLLAGYATTVKIVTARPTSPGEPVIHVSIGETDDEHEPLQRLQDEQYEVSQRQQPWEQFVHDSPSRPEIPLPEPLDTFSQKTLSLSETTQHANLKSKSAIGAESAFVQTPFAAAIAHDAGLSPDALSPLEKRSLRQPEPINVPAPRRRESLITGIVAAPGIAGPSAAEPSTSDRQDEPESKVGASTSFYEKQAELPRAMQTQPVTKLADALASRRDSPSMPGHGLPAELSEQIGRIDVPPPQRDSSSGRPYAAERVPRITAAAAGSSADAIDDVRNVPPAPANGRDDGLLVARSTHHISDKPLPPIYRLRVSADRSQLAISHGASEQTEAAVRAALRWLAQNQSADGRWESQKHQGGQELQVAGHNRLNAGRKADTAVTGLAILAFLAAGHTHEDGPYSENVRRALEFLLGQQQSNGSLAGRSTHFAAMYCHAIAAFALSEAYAMTHDPRLEQPVRRAVAHTLAAQDPGGGSWRYVPGDPGDTSQFGWQLMALKSAELAGIPIPAKCRQGMQRFLERVSSGRRQGLAAYRPGQPPSRSMTAEALACRQFLGLSPAGATAVEAGDYIIGQLPGEGRANFYYWYYATIGLYQLQGEHWRRWNDALQNTLLESQRGSGTLAGSWDPNSVWGGYGGRVYSTSLAALCLEVYYRFLPMYVEVAAKRTCSTKKDCTR